MNKQELQELLAPNELVRHFYCYDVVDSTMSQARRILADGAADDLHGTLILTDHQTTGRGRHGRDWNAPPRTSILATLILSRDKLPGQPDALQLSLLASAMPTAVCKGVATVLPTAAIKYPNDIVSEGRKLGGVLLEVQSAAIIVGFGLNCSQSLADFPTDLKMPATSIFLETGKTVSREKVLAAIMQEAQHLLQPELFATAGDEMRELCDTLGKNVMVDIGESEILHGVARTITPEGVLILETAAGSRQIYTSQVIRTWNPDSEMLPS